MFGEHIYQSSNFSHLYSQHLDRSKVFRHFELPATERSVLVNTIHMLLDRPSEIYQLKTSSQTKEAYYVVCDQGIQLDHLSSTSLKRCLEEFAQYGKHLQYIKYESKRIYQFSNALLKAFVENMFDIVNMVEISLTDKLKILQQENGKIQRSELEYDQSQENPITLMSLLKDLKRYGPILSFMVAVLNKLGLKDSCSSQDLQKAVLFLLNLYYEECSKEYCIKGSDWNNYLHILFKNIIKEYFSICKDWFQMNESTLAMKVHFGFFVQLDQILSLQEEKIFDVKKITKKQSVPQLFRESHKKVIELGKTIQFIKLYFGPQDKQEYRLFMNIDGEFQPLFSYLDSLSQRKPQEFVFFKPKKFEYQTISSKLSSIVKPEVAYAKVTKDNPYKIFPEMTGILNLRSDYQFRERQLRKKNSGNIMVSSRVKKDTDYSGLDINRQIDTIFNEILERITSKCLQILQKDRIRQSIERTLKGIKKIMLFQQGDFIQQLLELTKQILEKPADKISRNNIERLIEEAVRSSGAKNLSQIIRQNISFTFFKLEQKKGWRVFSLMYKPQKPTHCIFTSQVMRNYGYLSNMIFNLRHCEMTLIQIWSVSLAEGMGVILKARNAVHHYIKALESYIFSEIQVLWTELLDSIHQNGNILTILQVNESIIQKMKALTFQNQPLCNCLHSLIRIVDKFQSIRKDLSDGFEENLRADINQIWSWFLATLDQSRQISHFSDTFDFRGEYSL